MARATLRRAAEEMRREEEERRAGFEAGATALYTRARDIALAAYDGDGAAEAMIVLAGDIHGSNAKRIAQFPSSEAAALGKQGDDRGSNVHLVAAIALRRKLLEAAAPDDERGDARIRLGNVLALLGERKGGTEKLEEAVEASRSSGGLSARAGSA